MRKVTGIHPITGEIIEVQFMGAFPMKDPDTNHFIIERHEGGEPDLDDKGEIQIKFPTRSRLRSTKIIKGRLYPDQRPMATAVAFGRDVEPEQRVQEMLDKAYNEQRQKMINALESGQEFYPTGEEEDDDFFDEFVDEDMPVGSTEFEFDPDVGQEVPRVMKGAIRSVFAPPEKPKEEVSSSRAPKVAQEEKTSSKPRSKPKDDDFSTRGDPLNIPDPDED